MADQLKFTTSDFILQYQKIDEGIELVSLSLINQIKILYLPDVIDGLPVISIGERFLVNINDSIEEIKFPFHLKRIKEKAFRRSEYLEKIIIPSSLEEIGDYAFEYCDELLTVTFEKNSNIKRLGKACFKGCSKLTKMDLPDGLEIIEERAFYDCANRKYSLVVTIPKSVKKIENSAFGQFILYNHPLYKKIRVCLSCYTIISLNEFNVDENLDYIIEYKTDFSIEIDRWIYHIDENGALIKKGFNDGPILKIPESVIVNDKTYPVYGILSGAFNLKNINLEEIVFPSSIRYLETSSIIAKSIKKPVFLPKGILKVMDKPIDGNPPFIHLPHCEMMNTPFSTDTILLTEDDIQDNPNYNHIKAEDIGIYDQYYYAIVNSRIALIHYFGNKTTVVTPNEIEVNGNKYPVVALFSSLYEQSKRVKKIIIGKNVEFLFSHFAPLQVDNISLEDGSELRYIGSRVFSNCSEDFVLPSGVEFIDNYGIIKPASQNKPNLIIDKLEKLQVILDGTFNGYEIKKIVFPKTIKYIDENVLSKEYESIEFESGADPIYVSVSRLKEAKNISYNRYKGGLYLGSNDNPYLMLVEFEEIGRPVIEIHKDTRLICDKSLNNCVNAEYIVLSDSLIGIWSTLDCHAFPIIEKWPSSLKYVNDIFMQNINIDKSAPLPSDITITPSYSYKIRDMLVERPVWYEK